MILSSKDIKKRDFRKSLRGFDTDEVDAFLETVSSHYEKLLVENRNQADRIKSLLQDIDIYKENELNLQKAIIKSQDLGEEIVANAKKKSDNIIRTAELDARTIKQELEDDILSKRQELEEIKQKNEKTFDDLRNFLHDKITELDEFFKNRKILNMELSTPSEMHHYQREEAESHEEEVTEKPMKKISLTSQSLEHPDGSFDDSFEIKK
ncbi:MAG: DivIVA domain-containing protein [Ignavibacteria bacterium]